MKDVERLAVVGKGCKEIGFFDENKNFVKLDDMVSHLAINVFQSLSEIENGEKKAEETNVKIEISALNSLSNALSALAEYTKSFQN